MKYQNFRKAYPASMISLVIALTLPATGWGFELANINDVRQGELLLNTENPNEHRLAPIISTDVVIYVTGVVARTKVRQQFTNPGSDWMEGIYAFPLPENAAVDHMRMVVGGRIIELRRWLSVF
jgi:Ca-activated chloride channel family protein